MEISVSVSAGTRIALAGSDKLKSRTDMPIDLDSALGLHPQALTVRAKRAEALAQNLANADTPNFKARDIDFRAALAQAQQQLEQGRPPMTATHPMHLPLDEGGPANPALLYRQPLQASLDGNTVDTQKEHAEFMENAVRYQASLQFLGQRLRTLLIAIRGE
jgi:flagellar basal-body rod protein FlgB